MGRRPQLNKAGERLAKVVVKTYPSEWEAFGRAVRDEERSAAIREFMRRVIRKAALKRRRKK